MNKETINNKVLLTGHYGSVNRGCEAILRCTADIIRRHLNSINISVISSHPQSDEIALKNKTYGLEIYDGSIRGPKRFSLQWFIITLKQLATIVSPPHCWLGKNIFLKKKIYDDCSVLMQIGGDNYCYDYYVDTLLEELKFARLNKIPAVIWAASIGPFHKEVEEKCSRSLQKVDLITVREDITLQYLQKIGVIKNVRRVADPAFLLQSSSDGVLPIPRAEGDTIVGIGMSSLVSEYGSKQDGYLEAFVIFLKSLLTDQSIKVMLVPHVIYTSSDQDDLSVCKELANHLCMPVRVTVIDNNYNVCQMKYVISQCDYFIGARMHSTIASMSSGVPTISIAYSQKAYGINQDIFGHTDYVIPISSLNSGLLFEKYNLLCRDRHKIIEHLKKTIPAQREAANRGGQYLSELLQKMNLSLQYLSS